MMSNIIYDIELFDRSETRTSQSVTRQETRDMPNKE